ncbi:hypothetical protein [Bradyrhizobium sp. DASA03120]|uniref:hypothetical protein n=1 Tax=Bradyrhizobium sp. SMVTL-02 TaxID=3395917 RepID=UPI003F708DE0
MTSGYYAYIIGHDGHIKERIDLVCDNDEEAKRSIEQLVDGHAIELWQETRWVVTYRPQE